ncbi:MAG: DNA recombination protein RmuC [Hyphomonadaceae bacterium]|nr:DNA recombination protein RmuC [Hyphomonadaceae bacterium]
MPESLPALLLAAAAIAAAVWFAYRASKAGEAAATAKARFEGVDLIRAERDRLAGECETLREEAGRLRSELAAERAAASTRQAAAEEHAKALTEHFGALAARALDANQQRFLSLANETFEKHRQAAQGGVKEVVTPAQEALAKLATQVEALEKARKEEQGALTQQMRTIGEDLKEHKNVTGKLVHALRQSPKARGRWGEHSLRNALEMGGLAPRVDFEEQTTVDGDGGKLRPDVVIKMPGGRSVVVDSKVAFSAFLDAIEAPDEAARELLLKKHASELRNHMKALSSKEYWKHLPSTDTVDFVVMFVPGDNLVHEAYERDHKLQDEAFASKVIIAGPSGMVALARIIAFGWRQEHSAKNAQEIATLGRQLYERLSQMAGNIGDVGKALGDSVTAFNTMIHNIDTRVFVTARKFKELGAADAGKEINPVEMVEASPRRLAAPEQLELTPPPPRRGR